MKTYRVYFARGDGRLDLGDSFTCAGDEEAIARAREVRPPRGASLELWEGGRLVIHIPEASRPS